MKYKILDQNAATRLARELLDGKHPTFADDEQEVGIGTSFSDKILTAIAKAIAKQRDVIEKNNWNKESLDAVAFEIVHKSLPFDPDMLADEGFWTRFALVYVFDLIRWRFPGRGPKGFNLENVGIAPGKSKRSENYLFKLWVRGELSRTPGDKDEYRLGRYGSIDFWTSHIHRQGFPACRQMAVELIRFQYPPERKGQPRLFHGEEDVPNGKIGVRTLVKRIRRLWATVEYTLLKSDELRALITELSKGLKAADGKSVYSGS